MAQRDTSVSELCRELGIRPVTLYTYASDRRASCVSRARRSSPPEPECWTATLGGHPLSVGSRPLPQTTRPWPRARPAPSEPRTWRPSSPAVIGLGDEVLVTRPPRQDEPRERTEGPAVREGRRLPATLRTVRAAASSCAVGPRRPLSPQMLGGLAGRGGGPG